MSPNSSSATVDKASTKDGFSQRLGGANVTVRAARPLDASPPALDRWTPRITSRTAASGRTLLRALVGIDVLGVAAAWFVAFAVGSGDLSLALGRVGLISGISILLAAHSGLYDPTLFSVPHFEAARVLRVGVTAGLLALAVPFFAGTEPSVAAAVLGAVLTTFFVGTARGLFHAWLRHERASGRFVQRVAVVGYEEEAERLIELIGSRPDLGLRVCAMAGDRETAFRHGIEWLGRPHAAVHSLAAIGVSGVVISPIGMAGSEFNLVAQEMARQGLTVHCSTGLQEVDHRRLRPAALANESFLSLEASTLSRRQLVLKRTLDLTISSAVLLVTAPVWLVAALAVKLQDRGPVFFRQVRVGRDGKLFTVLKFRTMVVDAESRVAELRAQNARHGPLFKVASDPRTTKIGRVLRATSLDELPQLFNVLQGTMSLVGPRPALPSEVATFDDRHLERHRVAPGITGLWQVEARDNPSFQAYRHLDLFYVENWSCALDLILLWNTGPAIVARALRSLLRRQDIVADAGGQTEDRHDRIHTDSSPVLPAAVGAA